MKVKALVLKCDGSNYSHDGKLPKVVVAKSKKETILFTDKHHEHFKSKGYDCRELDLPSVRNLVSTSIKKGLLVVGCDLPFNEIYPSWEGITHLKPTDIADNLGNHIFDLKTELSGLIGHTVCIHDAVEPTLGKGCKLKSYESPALWKKGSFKRIIQDCIDDAGNVFQLWKHGSTEGFINVRSRLSGIVERLEVEW